MNGNIVLIGFMGSGKSCVGIRLAKALDYQFVDTDALIENKYNCKISEIFSNFGEERFRTMETEILSDLSGKSGCVISTGGGMPLREENARMLSELGCVIYLKTSAEVTYLRLKHDTTRPLLQSPNPKEKITKLLEERIPKYENVADASVVTDNKSFDQILHEIHQIIKEQRG